MLTINTVGPTIMNYGSEEQKKFFLPKILAGEIHFCIGYSEPNAGTDLAALQTRAVVDGDELVINGAKIFTSLAGDADYCWLAVRTDPEAPKHKGISMVIVPMDTPGVRVVPMHLLGEHNINYTFWEDVRVPATNIVGGINNGWSLITNQLNHERVTLCSPGIIERALGDVRSWAQQTKLADGRRVIDQEWVQLHLARVYAKLEFLKLINWKVAWQGTQGRLDVADASSIKVFGTEFYMEALRTLSEVIGQAGYLKRGSPGAALKGRLEMYSRESHHPDLRRRDQRDPARPDRHLRTGHAPVPALTLARSLAEQTSSRRRHRADADIEKTRTLTHGLRLHRGPGRRSGARRPNPGRPLHP